MVVVVVMLVVVVVVSVAVVVGKALRLHRSGTQDAVIERASLHIRTGSSGGRAVPGGGGGGEGLETAQVGNPRRCYRQSRSV